MKVNVRIGKRLEKDLKRSASRLEQVLGSSGQMIWKEGSHP